jgi:inosose dehydratase
VPVALARAETHATGIETAVQTARLMRDAGTHGACIVLSDANASVPAREQRAGRIAPEDGLDDRHWTTFGDGAERIARAVQEETGLRTVFHPHCGGYVETEAEIDQLMARTPAALVGLLIDTGHIMYGGGDPLRVLKRHASRVTHVHFKDCDPKVANRARAQGLGYLAAVREQLFCELGQGAVDFEAVAAELRRLHYDGWIVVEQDVFPGYGTPAESAKRSRDYLRRLGL